MKLWLQKQMERSKEIMPPPPPEPVKEYRIWLLDTLRFRYGITVMGDRNSVQKLEDTLSSLNCFVESVKEYDAG